MGIPMVNSAVASKRQRRTETPGARARQIRAGLGLTIAQIAKKAGLGVGAVCDFENGKRVLRTDTLMKLAAALGVPASSLLDD
jgi:transcriptional regulator with XRE-family HTH domain